MENTEIIKRFTLNSDESDDLRIYTIRIGKFMYSVMFFINETAKTLKVVYVHTIDMYAPIEDITEEPNVLKDITKFLKESLF